MSWRNEPERNEDTQRSPLGIGTVVSYVLIFLAAATIFYTLQIGYSLASDHGCTFSQASNLAWHWFAGGPFWLVAVAFIWVIARALANRFG